MNAWVRDRTTPLLTTEHGSDWEPDLQHHMCVRMQDDRLYVSPAGREKPLKRVLDCGTGTGIWAIDFGMYPA
jgi:ribosomal protein L11 methylase PrmA